MSTTTKNESPRKDPVATFRDQILAEEPKIDAAIKSFCSWIVSENDSIIAELMESTSTTAKDNDNDEPPIAWTMANTLPCARTLSKAINAYIVPIQYKHNVAPIVTPQALMEDICVQVWNDAASGGIRLTKALGRTSLRYIWKDLVAEGLSKNDIVSGNTINTREHQAFLQLFGKLLMNDGTTTTATAVNAASTLVWGGPDVLAQRATQRLAAAAQRVKESQASAADAQELPHAAVSPMIEELPSEDS